MSDNKRQDDPSLLVAQLAGVLAVAFVFAPMLQGLALVGLVLGVGVAFGVVLYWVNHAQPDQPAAPPAVAVNRPAEEAAPSIAPAEIQAPPVRQEPSGLAAPSGLMERLRAADPDQFARVVETTCRNLGYSVSRHGGQDSIDLIVENESGCSALHCRHWNAGAVPAEAIREFAGALAEARVSRGVFLTRGVCAAEARRTAAQGGIELLDETGLGSLLRAVDAENSPEIQALLSEPRKVCPECESELVLETATGGEQGSLRFWSCSARPKCQYTVPML